jgi:hypothetical protein
MQVCLHAKSSFCFSYIHRRTVDIYADAVLDRCNLGLRVRWGPEVRIREFDLYDLPTAYVSDETKPAPVGGRKRSSASNLFSLVFGGQEEEEDTLGVAAVTVSRIPMNR